MLQSFGLRDCPWLQCITFLGKHLVLGSIQVALPEWRLTYQFPLNKQPVGPEPPEKGLRQDSGGSEVLAQEEPGIMWQWYRLCGWVGSLICTGPCFFPSAKGAEPHSFIHSFSKWFLYTHCGQGSGLSPENPEVTEQRFNLWDFTDC